MGMGTVTMSRPCLACVSEHTATINEMLCRGKGATAISREIDGAVSAEGISRHKTSNHHQKGSIESKKADSTDELNAWISRADKMYALADEKHDLTRMDKALTMAAKFLELRMKRDGELLTDNQRRQKEVQGTQKQPEKQTLTI